MPPIDLHIKTCFPIIQLAFACRSYPSSASWGIISLKGLTGFDCLMQNMTVKGIACGAEHSLVSNSRGEIYSFGWGRYGNLGLGEKADRYKTLSPQLLVSPKPTSEECDKPKKGSCA